MQRILLIQAAEGMVLAKDVHTPEGRVLCGKGTTLSFNLIDRLEKMEIVTITVEGHPVEIEGEKSLEEEIEAIEIRFSRINDNPPLTYIKNRLIDRLISSRSE